MQHAQKKPSKDRQHNPINETSLVVDYYCRLAYSSAVLVLQELVRTSSFEKAVIGGYYYYYFNEAGFSQFCH